MMTEKRESINGREKDIVIIYIITTKTRNGSECMREETEKERKMNSREREREGKWDRRRREEK